MDILVFNPGSTTLKVALVRVTNGATVSLWSDSYPLSNPESTVRDIIRNHPHDAIVCRYVHGGKVIVKPERVDTALLKSLAPTKALAPLHNPISLLVMRVALRESEAPLVVDPDTGFHRTLSRAARATPLSSSLGVSETFGFHGIAHKEISQLLTWKLGEEGAPRDYLITCQLGGGASICAVAHGASIDVSMKYSPLEGIVMGTRSGNLDPNLIIDLIEAGWDTGKLRAHLNTKSGLVGMAGTYDVRALLDRSSTGESQAELALEVFCTSVAKGIASMSTALPRIDAIAFSGGIGQNSGEIRARVCQKLACFGIELDPTRNVSTENLIEPQKVSYDDCRPAVWAIPCFEANGLARAAASLLTN